MPSYDTAGLPLPVWGPSGTFQTITPNDATDLSPAKIRGIYVGGAGNLAVQGFNDDDTITFVAVPAGTLLPIMVKKVMAATTATNLVGLS